MKKVATNEGTTKKPGGITGKGFMPGQSGNPKGTSLPKEVREALRADSLMLYEKAKTLLDKAIKDDDKKVAASLVLGLLKKTIPDVSAIEVTGEDGGPVQVQRIDASKLSAEELVTLRAMLAKSGGGK